MSKLRPPIRRLKGGPLNRGLEACWFLGGYGPGYDLTRKTTLTYSAGFSWQASPIGRGARATASSDRVDTSALPQLDEWTWLFWGFCETTGGGAFGRFVAAKNDSEFALTFNASGTALSLYLNSATPQGITVPSLLDKPVLVVIRTVPGSATDVEVWINGIGYGTFTYTANAIETGAWRLGNRFTSLNRAWGGHIHLSAVWSRSLPMAQIREIMADPYAMCERVEPWWMQAAGGGQEAGAVAFEATAALAAAGAARMAGSVSLGAEASLAAGGALRVAGAAEFAGEALLAASGARRQAGSVAFDAEAALTATGARRMAGALALSAEAAFDVAGALRAGGSVSLAADGTLSIDGAARAAGAVAFSAEGLLSIASQAGAGAVEFGADAVIEFAGRARMAGAASFGGEAAVEASGARRQAGAAALDAEGSIAVTARLRQAGAVAFEAAAILAFAGEPANDAVSVWYLLVPDYGTLTLRRPVYGGLELRVPEYGDLLLEAA